MAYKSMLEPPCSLVDTVLLTGVLTDALVSGYRCSFSQQTFIVVVDNNSHGMSDAERIVDETRRFEGGTVARAVILEVPQSDEYPDGYKIRLHYGTEEGKTLLRYDNSHGVFEKHTGSGDAEPVDVGYFEAYERFKQHVKEKEEVDRIW